MCSEIDDPAFIHAAAKLAKTEAESNLSYEEVIARLEKAKLELPSAEKKVKEVEAKLAATNKALAEKRKELASLEDHVAQLQKDAKAKETELDHELVTKMKQLKVKLGELKEVSELKAKLAKSGLGLATLADLAKEFSHDSTKG